MAGDDWMELEPGFVKGDRIRKTFLHVFINIDLDFPIYANIHSTW